MEIFDTVVQWFSRGGMVMYLLLLCSVMSVAVIIERFRYFRCKSVNYKLFSARLLDCMEKKSLREIREIYRKESSAAAIVVEAGVRAVQGGRDPEAAMENAARLEAAKLKKGLSLLGVTVTLAPVLGLLGTVVGMINSFSVFNLQQGAPMAITGGVGEALVATASGLMVAILALVGHSYYGHRLDSIMTAIEQIAVLFVEKMPAYTAGRMREVEKCA
ncbi:MotA/TolQ/ExbB proton channel family protein [Anaerovibrio sp.]|uniref:MotA/TolQ/ExbB proton channel family protein n=1 Tax=Anaerovibrio sp. TaxID=1872532 RepID=UPI003F15B6AF